MVFVMVMMMPMDAPVAHAQALAHGAVRVG